MTEPWYVAYFDQAYYDEYATGHKSEAQTSAEVEFACRTLELQPGARVLDLGCGYGRHAVELAARGCEVVAFDLSPSLLTRAVQHAADRGVAVSAVAGDMRSLPFAGNFDAVLSMFTSFGFFSDGEDAAVLCGIAVSLRPGGRVLLDLDNGARALKEFRDQFWRRLPQGGFVLSEGRYDADTGRMEGRRVHIDGSGVVREYALSLRVYTRAEMTHLLGDAGLRVVKVWGDFSGRQYEWDAPRMIFVCEKVPKRQEGFP